MSDIVWGRSYSESLIERAMSTERKSMEHAMHMREMRERSRRMYMAADLAYDQRDSNVEWDPRTGQVRYTGRDLSHRLADEVSHYRYQVKELQEQLADKVKERGKKLQDIISYYYTRR